MKNRIMQVDILRMVAMCLVMYQHANGPFSLYILAFHMPIFFVITGFTFSISNSWQTTRTIDFVIKRAKGILIANYSFIFINVVLNIIISLFTTEKFSLSIKTLFLLGGNTTGLLPMTFWFLPILFFADIFFFLALKSMKNVVYFTITSLLFSYILTKTPQFSRFIISNQLSMIFMGSFFIGLGYIFGKQIYKLLTGEYQIITNISIGVVSFIGLVYFVHLNYSPFYMFMNSYGSYVWASLGAICGSAFLISIIRFFPNIKFMNRFITWGGRNTLALFPVHVTLLAAIVYVENRYHFTISMLWLFNLIIMSTGAFAITRGIEIYLPFLLGKTKTIKSKKL